MGNKKLFAREQIERIDLTFLIEGAKKITNADIENVISKENEILKKFEPDGPLGRFSEDFVIANLLVKDYHEKKYTEIPHEAIAAIIFTLSYVLNPIDLIPDPISEIGYLDDLAVIAVCRAHIHEEIDKYHSWKVLQGN